MQEQTYAHSALSRLPEVIASYMQEQINAVQQDVFRTWVSNGFPPLDDFDHEVRTEWALYLGAVFENAANELCIVLEIPSWSEVSPEDLREFMAIVDKMDIFDTKLFNSKLTDKAFMRSATNRYILEISKLIQVRKYMDSLLYTTLDFSKIRDSFVKPDISRRIPRGPATVRRRVEVGRNTPVIPQGSFTYTTERED